MAARKVRVEVYVCQMLIWLDPSYEQQRDFDGELSRKLPADPEAKIEKFSKLLNKFHRLYLTECKKATRLEEVSDRFKVRLTLLPRQR